MSFLDVKEERMSWPTFVLLIRIATTCAAASG